MPTEGIPLPAAEVSISPIGSAEQCGVVAEASHRESLTDWIAAEREFLDGLVHTHGAVLLRGFSDAGDEDIRKVVTLLSGPPLDYTERSSPRSEVAAGIYTSTDYPAEKRIFLHNEQSYNLRFPERLYFHCRDAADQGGETLLADSRRVLSRIPADTRERFAREGYLLVRNYRPHMGLPWQDVFQTADRSDVARYCATNGIDVEWLGPDELRTTQRREVVAAHPVTGESCWFNHLTFFHVSTLGDEIADLLVEAYGEDGVSTNTFHGDGTPIAPEVLTALRDAYERECVAPPWRTGDLLVVDNLLASHGRAAFTGSRRVVVSMAGTLTWDQVRSAGDASS
jgi:alpha-ketoglutarate-dependent taurine dioxygenase